MDRTETEARGPSRAEENGAASKSIVERAIALSSALREGSNEATRLRRLPDATWKALLDAGILRGLQPSRWGGGEVNPADFFEAVSEVARADGSHGWVTGIIGVHPWQTRAVSDRDAARGLGRRSRRHALVVIRADWQGAEGNRRISAEWTMVLLDRMRPLPMGEPRRHHRRDRSGRRAGSRYAIVHAAAPRLQNRRQLARRRTGRHRQQRHRS